MPRKLCILDDNVHLTSAYQVLYQVAVEVVYALDEVVVDNASHDRAVAVVAVVYDVDDVDAPV